MKLIETISAIRADYAKRIENPPLFLVSHPPRAWSEQEWADQMRSERDRELWRLRPRIGIIKRQKGSSEDHMYLLWPVKLVIARKNAAEPGFPHGYIWRSWFTWHGWQVCWAARGVSVYGWTYHLGPLKVIFGQLPEFDPPVCTCKEPTRRLEDYCPRHGRETTPLVREINYGQWEYRG